ncbi:MAG: InlB B-repeat-containing protein, partial [Lachnospiraceae bacterium]|nr:InlB B-repeat-containing protein [Lachnospiraceae bacterium]
NKNEWIDFVNGTDAKLSKTMAASWDGLKIRCVISDKYGITATSDVVTLTLAKALKITKQPVDVSAKSGAPIMFDIAAEGDGVTYKWQYKWPDSNAWEEFSNSNVTKLSRTMTASWAGLKIRCIVSDKNGKSETSNEVTLSLIRDIVITKQPVSVTANEGEAISFEIGAEGDGLTYKWQYQWPNKDVWEEFSNSNVTKLSRTMAAGWDGLKIRCVVSDKWGISATSNVVSLGLKITSISIVDPLTDYMMAVGEKYKFKVETTPANVTGGITWSSSDEDVIIIDDEGNAEAVGFGETGICASSGDVSAYCYIRVYEVMSTFHANGGKFYGLDESDEMTCRLDPDRGFISPASRVYRTGYNFTAWYIDSECTEQVDDYDITEEPLMFRDLYAGWTDSALAEPTDLCVEKNGYFSYTAECDGYYSAQLVFSNGTVKYLGCTYGEKGHKVSHSIVDCLGCTDKYVFNVKVDYDNRYCRDFYSGMVVSYEYDYSKPATKLDSPECVWYDDEDRWLEWEEVEHAAFYKVFMGTVNSKDEVSYSSPYIVKGTSRRFGRFRNQKVAFCVLAYPDDITQYCTSDYSASFIFSFDEEGYIEDDYTVETGKYTVSLNANGGLFANGTDSKTIIVPGINDRSTIEAEAGVPERDCYEFTGWYNDVNCSNALDIKGIKSDCTLYAGWRLARSLVAPDDLHMEPDGDLCFHTKCADAYYELTIYKPDGNCDEYGIGQLPKNKDHSLYIGDLFTVSGQYRIIVRPTYYRYQTSIYSEITYTYINPERKLAAPSGIKIENGILSWNAVEGAGYYEINWTNDEFWSDEWSPVKVNENRYDLYSKSGKVSLADGNKYFIYAYPADIQKYSRSSSSDMFELPEPGRPLKITKQPEDVYERENSDFTCTIAAEGDVYRYDWQYRLPGETEWNSFERQYNEPILWESMKAEWDGAKVRCIVEGVYERSVTSDEITLNLVRNIEITKQPVDVTAASGEAISFEIEATGDELKYCWQYRWPDKDNWEEFSNGNVTTLERTMQAGWDYLSVRCVVSDKWGKSAISRVALLSLTKTPKITKQPEDTSAVPGSLVIFEVAAEGDGLTYKWQYMWPNGNEWIDFIEGTEAELNKIMQKGWNGLKVRCIVGDEDGNSATSRVVTLGLAPEYIYIIDPAPEEQWVVGDTRKLLAKVVPEGATGDVNWSSDNEKVIKIDNDGNAEVVGTGWATITARVGDISANYDIYTDNTIITYHANGGRFVGAGNPEEMSVRRDDTNYLISPAALYRDGYHFTAWYTDPECTKRVLDIDYCFDVPLSSLKDLYAGWSDDELIKPGDLHVDAKGKFSFMARCDGYYTVRLVYPNGHYRDLLSGKLWEGDGEECDISGLIKESGRYLFMVKVNGEEPFDTAIIDYHTGAVATYEFNYTKPSVKLDTPTGIHYDEDSGMIKWNSVPNAAYYVVEYKYSYDGDGWYTSSSRFTKNEVEARSISYYDYGYALSVMAYPDGIMKYCESDWSEVFSYPEGSISIDNRTITFDANEGAFNDGSAFKSLIVLEGEWIYEDQIAVIGVPKRDGYMFTGWFSDKNMTESVRNWNSGNDMTVYAGWKAGSRTAPSNLQMNSDGFVGFHTECEGAYYEITVYNYDGIRKDYWCGPVAKGLDYTYYIGDAFTGSGQYNILVQPAYDPDAVYRDELLYYSQITYDYVKPARQLAAPTGLKLEGSVLSWAPVENAAYYVVHIYSNGDYGTNPLPETGCDLDGLGIYDENSLCWVVAYPADFTQYNKSPYSAILTIPSLK